MHIFIYSAKEGISQMSLIMVQPANIIHFKKVRNPISLR